MSNTDYLSSIDIGSSQIAIVGCELFDGQDIIIRHATCSPSQGIDRGYVSNIQKASESLKNALTKFEQKSKKKVSKVALSIGGIGLASQYVKTRIELKRQGSEITSHDTQELIEKAELLFSEKYPNKKILHVIPISYKVDDRDVLGSPTGMFGSYIEAKIIIVTVPEHHFDSLVTIAEAADLQIEDITAAPLADAASCLSYEQKKQGCVLVNIGAETTQISTYEQGLLTSLKVIGLGSGDITNDLALGLKIPIEQAQEIKHGKNKDFSDKQVQEIHDARLSDIIESVEKHLRNIKKNRLLPAGVVWTGNGSQIQHLNEHAKSMLHIPSEQVSLEQKSKDNKRKISISPKYSTSYGMCKLEDSGYSSRKAFSFKGLKKKINYWIGQLKP